MFISMTARSQNKDLAARFINFFVNDLGAGEIENPLMRNIMQEILLDRLTVDNGLAQIVRDSNAVLARENR